MIDKFFYKLLIELRFVANIAFTHKQSLYNKCYYVSTIKHTASMPPQSSCRYSTVAACFGRPTCLCCACNQ